ncbi:MAG: hypothetical protein ACR652_21810 [Methylocystis sp.]|uniref:hypothetical protein n=1 Tax=Methylocystis sp. TaxID=1911079 RepID=UPI003DA5E666
MIFSKKMGDLGRCLAIALLLSVASAPAEETVGARGHNRAGEGEMRLVLTYKAPIEKRVAFRKYMESSGVTQFEEWRSRGVFSGYKFLFATQVNEHLPDMWVIIDFAKFSDIAKWQGIERDYPGGLGPEGVVLAAPRTEIYANLGWQGGTPKADQSKSLYMIIPYISFVAGEKYEDFANKYVVPQLNGWVESGLMPSYAVYLNQNPTNAPWHSLLVLEYDGIRGVALRDSLKGTIRAKLANDPGYAQYSEIKTTIRKELEPATFEVILPH